MHGANDRGNGRETVAQRAKATASERNKDLAWEDLLSVEGTKRIPLDFRKFYRQARLILLARWLGAASCHDQ